MIGYDVSENAEDYMHRIRRTGRVHHTGEAVPKASISRLHRGARR